MAYSIHGSFVEACDCRLICPCWLDDAPDEEHCTGLFAWRLGTDSTINGVAVGGRTVVSVSTHSGGRRGGRSSTAIFVDDGADDAQFKILHRAFAGELDGPLAELAAVSGIVLQRIKAAIEVTDGPQDGWGIKVTATDGSAPLLTADGAPRVFDHEDAALTLRNTALSHELGVPGPGDVTAHRGGAFSVHVPVLPGAYLDVAGRSAMTGRFRYEHPRRPEPRG